MAKKPKKKKRREREAVERPPDENQLKQEVKELDRAIKAKEKERDALEAALPEKVQSEFEELIRYARRRKHTWLDIPTLFFDAARRDDASNIARLVVMTVRTAVMDFEHDEINPLKDQRSAKRKELRTLKE